MRPQCVERTRRHGPLTGHGTRRQVPDELMAAAPADCECAHLQIGSYRQSLERAQAEGPDARRVSPEERGGIERDPQARPLRLDGRAVCAQVVIAPSMERMAPVT
jgi:hypothetical protein